MADQILLGIPHSGSVRWETAVSAMGAPTNNGKSRVTAIGAEASLLSFNFNQLWAIALNRREEYRYFAMLHSDIAHDPGWIDALLEEMREHSADIVGAVSPIKDGRGVTSCGIGYPDQWRVPLKRFTMKELQDMPETFSAADIGYPDNPLLINSGSWVADLKNDKWLIEEQRDGYRALRVHFTINDTIDWDPEDGIWKARVQSEDWFFSIRAWQVGLRVALTQKVKLDHYGRSAWSTNKVWGRDHDNVKLPERVGRDEHSERRTAGTVEEDRAEHEAHAG